jgi:glycerate kinase
MRIVAAPDKFRGTASAAQVARAIAAAATSAGWTCDEIPVADGGEGTLEALGGANRKSLVTGPLGDEVWAEWRLSSKVAVIEMARASGLDLVGGIEGNRPLEATTTGTGELIAEAVAAGARRVIVGVGGSATTDGGLGALRAMEPIARFAGVDIEVACDVRLFFVEAAARFGPQKGATDAQVKLLAGRLERLGQVYLDDFGVDVTSMIASGAAGGLAGGLAAIGGTLVPGFDLVADEVGLSDAIEGADLVVTGEGFIDDQSFDGKVVGGVAEIARELGVPVLAVAGQVFDGPIEAISTVSLADRFGMKRALVDTLALVEDVVADHLAKIS